MIFIWYLMNSVMRTAVGWKPVVVEVLNLLLNLIDSALPILSVKLTSCVSCVLCVGGRAVKSEDSCDVSEPPAVHWFDNKPIESAIVRCVSIASNACDAVRSRVLLPKRQIASPYV